MDWKTFVAEALKAIAWPAIILYIAYRFHAPIFSLLEKLAKVKSAEMLGAKLHFDEGAKLVSIAADKLPPVEVSTLPSKAVVSSVPDVQLPASDIRQDSLPDESVHFSPIAPPKIPPSQTKIQSVETQKTLDFSVEFDQLDHLTNRALNMSDDDTIIGNYLIITAWNIIENSLKKVVESRNALDNQTHSKPSSNVLGEVFSRRLLPPEHIQVLRSLRMLRNQTSHSIEPEISQSSIIDYLDSADKVLRAIAAEPVKRAPRAWEKT